LSTGAGGACEGPAAAVDNAGRTTDFMRCGSSRVDARAREACLGRDAIAPRMRPVGVEPVQLAAAGGARRAYAVSGLEVLACVFHATPQAFDEDLVPPCAAPVQGELAAAASTVWVNSSALNWLP
jgi:hypothetical protein